MTKTQTEYLERLRGRIKLATHAEMPVAPQIGQLIVHRHAQAL